MMFGKTKHTGWNPKYDVLTAYNTVNNMAANAVDPVTRERYAKQQNWSPEHVAAMKKLQAEYDAEQRA